MRLVSAFKTHAACEALFHGQLNLIQITQQLPGSEINFVQQILMRRKVVCIDHPPTKQISPPSRPGLLFISKLKMKTTGLWYESIDDIKVAMTLELNSVGV